MTVDDHSSAHENVHCTGDIPLVLQASQVSLVSRLNFFPALAFFHCSRKHRSSPKQHQRVVHCSTDLRRLLLILQRPLIFRTAAAASASLFWRKLNRSAIFALRGIPQIRRYSFTWNGKANKTAMKLHSHQTLQVRQEQNV